MLKILKCLTCDNLFEMIHDSGVTPICCGEEMQRLDPYAEEGTYEKHVPFISKEKSGKICCKSGKEINVKRVCVEVGDLTHSMTEMHHIKWIALETDRGVYRKELKLTEQPKETFVIAEDEIIKGVYSYCNLHSLWASK